VKQPSGAHVLVVDDEPALLRTVTANLGRRGFRVEIARTKAQEALDLLDHLPPSGYAAQIGELRGDALVALKRTDDARAAYADALANLDPNAANRQFVQMKLNDLGTAEAKG